MMLFFISKIIQIIQMPVVIAQKTHQWLQKLSIFKHQPANSSKSTVEIAFNDEIYIRNGFYIGVILRKFVQPYQMTYNNLLGVRKIAQIKSPQNWAILQPILRDLGCSQLNNLDEDPESGEQILSETALSNIIEFLFEKYAPQQLISLSPGKKKGNKLTDLDFKNFNPNAHLSDPHNSLHFMCLLLVQTFKLNLSQALGLLIDNSKYLKGLIIYGSKTDQFEGVLKLYDTLIEYWPYFEKEIARNGQEVEYMLEGVGVGLNSEKQQVCIKTLELLELVKNRSWLVKKGNLKLLCSRWNQCFNFLLDRQNTALSSIFNQEIHVKVPNKLEFINILINLVRKIPQTIYSRQILTYIPISYFYQRCFQVLSPDQISNYPDKIIIATHQLLTNLISTFPHQIPSNYLEVILEIYDYYGNRSYGEQSRLIAMVFQIIQALLSVESRLSSKFFQLIMKYMKGTYGQIKDWIICNMKNLYEKKTRQFPLGFFLLMYPRDPISQHTEYELFQKICIEQSRHYKLKNCINEEQSGYLLKILHEYYSKQIHCKCYITLINMFASKNPELSEKWGTGVYQHTTGVLENINAPLKSNSSSLLNPPLPNKNRVVMSIGLKRKQMLKNREYDLLQTMLSELTKIKSKPFLQGYAQHLNNQSFRLSKEIGIKKTHLIQLYKQLAKKALKTSKTIFQSPHINLVLSTIKHRLQSSELSSNSEHFDESKIVTSNISPIVEQFEDQQDELFDRIQQSNTFRIQKEVAQLMFCQQQQNEFLSQAPSSRLQPINLHEQNYLLPFTEDESSVFPSYLSDELLQQHEIMYIKMMKNRYRSSIKKCLQLYNQQFEKDDFECMKYLKFLKIDQNISAEQAESIYLKACLYGSNNKEIIQNFLVQLGLMMFGFLKNKRITITSLDSFFFMLSDRLKSNQLLHSTNQHKDLRLVQSVSFSHNLADSLIHTQPTKRQSYFICFDVLSDIMREALTIPEAEPISIIANQFDSSLSSEQKKMGEELENLEQMLASKVLDDQKVLKKNNKMFNSFKKKEPTVYIDISKGKSQKSLDMGSLKNKLNLRRQKLQSEIKEKNFKNSSPSPNP